MLELINDGIRLLKEGIAYLQANGWYILILLVTFYYIKSNVESHIKERRYRPEPERKEDFSEDLRRVRLQQQELAQQKAIEVVKEKKKKEEAEKQRRNKAALPTDHDKGTRLGRPSTYNPMQPHTASSGGGYKANDSRCTRRG